MNVAADRFYDNLDKYLDTMVSYFQSSTNKKVADEVKLYGQYEVCAYQIVFGL